MKPIYIFGILAVIGLAIAVYFVMQEEKAKKAAITARNAAKTLAPTTPKLIPNPLLS